jgi:DNA-binding response OmpR family regulator
MTTTSRIFFLDDEPAIVEACVLAAGIAGYAVEGCSRPADALKRFEADPFGYLAILTDYTMAEMTCADFLARIRAIRADVPVYLCTGNAEHEIREAARTLAVGRVLYKPFDFDTLAAFLRDVLPPRG